MAQFEFADLMLGPAGAAALGAVALSIAAGTYGVRVGSGAPRPARSRAAREHCQPRIEERDPDLFESVAVSQRIADLMIADEWTEISRLVSGWENELASTPGGVRYHDVAADTCLSGLKGVIGDADLRGFEDLDPALAELAHFVDTHSGTPGDHVLALLAARAHLVVGDAYRTGSWPETQRRDAYRRMARHYMEAGGILAAYEPLAYMSPLLAETHYRQAAGAPGGAHRLPDLFETWIDLDPASPRIYEIHATYHLSNAQKVSDSDIREEAERALARTEETLGAGGYALFYLPLLAVRPGARGLMDEDLFVSALLDLATRDASQSDVNWVAAALAREIETAPAETANALLDVFYMLVRDHLTVAYPRLWDRSETDVLSLISGATSAAQLLPPGDSEFLDRAA